MQNNDYSLKVFDALTDYTKSNILLQVDPQMWQYWTGVAIMGAVISLQIIFPWDLPNDFPATQKEYDA